MNHSPPRPGSVITAAVLLFIYGTLTLFCNLASGAVVATNGWQIPGQQAVAQEFPAHPYIEIGVLTFSLLVNGSMIVAGIGVLRLMPMARHAAISLCGIDIVAALFHATYEAIVVFPLTNKIAAQAGPNPMANVEAFGQWFGLCFGLVLVLAFCIPIILFLCFKSCASRFRW